MDLYLDGKDPAQAETALALAADTTRAAHDSAMNDWLAARIAEGYLWPGYFTLHTPGQGTRLQGQGGCAL